jgi:beta-lactamase regulating signal transducer with metallopeptidase domain
MSAASEVLAFFLKSAVAFALVWAACQLLSSALWRYRIWLAVSICVTFAWVKTLLSFFFGSDIRGYAIQQAPHATYPATILTIHWPSDLSWLPSWAGSPSRWLLVYGIIAAGLLLCWTVAAARLAYGLQREAKQVPRKLTNALLRVCDEAQVATPALLLVQGLASPCTAGFWRPRILLPEGLDKVLDYKQLRDVLRHELVHIARLDYLIDRLASAICAVLFFHPGVWISYTHIRRDRELACDEAVAGNDPDGRAAYADCLLRIARWSGPHEEDNWSDIRFLRKTGSSLGRRVRRLIYPDTTSAAQRFLKTATALALLLFLAELPALQIRSELKGNPAFAPTIASVRTVSTLKPVAARRIRRHQMQEKAKTISTSQSMTSPNEDASLQRPDSALALLMSAPASQRPQARFVLSRDSGRSDEAEPASEPEQMPVSSPASPPTSHRSHPGVGKILMEAGILALQRIAHGGGDHDGKD